MAQGNPGYYHGDSYNNNAAIDGMEAGFLSPSGDTLDYAGSYFSVAKAGNARERYVGTVEQGWGYINFDPKAICHNGGTSYQPGSTRTQYLSQNVNPWSGYGALSHYWRETWLYSYDEKCLWSRYASWAGAIHYLRNPNYGQWKWRSARMKMYAAWKYCGWGFTGVSVSATNPPVVSADIAQKCGTKQYADFRFGSEWRY